MKTYLITGAAQGLGRTLTEQLYELGHQMILLDKDLQRLNALSDQLQQQEFTGRLALYPLDLLGADLQNWEEFGQVIETEFGKLDGVFLNAAILPAFTPIEHFDTKQWYEVMHTNLNANFQLIQQTLPLLLKAKGDLVAISDKDCFDKPAFYGAYGVAKAGLEQLIKSLANEHCEKCLHCYIARTPAFATEARGRLFPGENPMQLPQTSEIAAELLTKMGIMDKPSTDFIEIISTP
ncbi:SDR family NAD(P)-dependent oxidoreductase [Thiomicrorhabdus indica]|uniref:SDR family NAD(P)-dependent oxidoreductase n=1 Tax=Thiomicrorhabdus indica TaxID=2267253 RepID=UPI002AA81036|nr:SDR family NAD(P)-dependent oxidoreductase [Thiomicrorhabdus indica]